jgi:hypothetical protein
LLAATGCWQSTVPEKRMWNLATAVWAIASIGNVSPKISIKLCAILGQLALEPPAAGIACGQAQVAPQ